MIFIDNIAPLIQSKAFALGYKYPSAIIAQAIVESNYNKSLLSKEYCNYFGMKCGSSWKGKSVNLKTKEEYSPGTLTTIKDNFRTYSSMVEGVKGYFDFISSKRYKNLKNATSPRNYLELIKKDGWCTSSTYVNTCMNIINKYNLTKFDTKPKTTNSRNWVTEAINFSGLNTRDLHRLKMACVQKAFNLDYKSNLKVDGIKGPLTTKAGKNHYIKYGERQYLVSAVELISYLNGLDPKGFETPGTYGNGLFNATGKKYLSVDDIYNMC